MSASIVTAQLLALESEFERLLAAGVNSLHVDIEDGTFVPVMNLGTRIVDAAVQWGKLPIDVHLMVENPESVLRLLYGLPLQKVSFHAEATRYPRRVLKIIREQGWKASIAFNPATPLFDLSTLLPHLDDVLMLTTEPENGDTPFLKGRLAAVQSAVNVCAPLGVSVTVDGGVGLSNIRRVVDAGAETVVIGRALFESLRLEQMVKQIKKGDLHE